MNIKQNIPKFLIVGLLIGGVAVVGSKFFGSSAATTMGDVKEAQLTEQARAGKKTFDENCAQCHGAGGSGTDQGPPLIHNIYNPGHHADQAFFRAVAQGVRRHHWPFGDMPPQPKVSERQVSEIVEYVREVQRANGIFFSEHRM